MDNLLINPPGYSYVIPMAGEYQLGLLKLSSYLKSRGERTRMFDFYPRKDFLHSFVIKNTSDNLIVRDSYFPIHFNKELYCYKGQKYPLRDGSFSYDTGEYISRFGEFFPRKYNGVEYPVFREYLENNKPDRIWISGGVTFYYKGVAEVINICKEVYPDIEVVLGGIYPTLCYDHAKKHTKADRIIRGRYKEIERFPLDYDVLPNPPEYLIRQFSKGCPNRCKFCAVRCVEGELVETVNIDRDIQEIRDFYEKYKINRLKVWGSNKLYPERGRVFEEWLDKLMGLGIRFDLIIEEGVSSELLTPSICKKIYDAGALYLPIGLESSAPDRLMGKSYGVDAWKRAVDIAWKAGFPKNQIHGSIIYGFPGETIKDLINTLKIVTEAGVRAMGRPYIPVPLSEWFESDPKYKNMDLELLQGELLLAITDENLFKETRAIANYLVDWASCGMLEARKMFLENLYERDKRERDNMINVELVNKIAKIIIDISEQNEEILSGIRKISSDNRVLAERIDKLEKKEINEEE